MSRKLRDSQTPRFSPRRVRLLAAAVGIASLAPAGAVLSGCEVPPRMQERVFTERSSYRLTSDGDRAVEKNQPELAREHYRAALEMHPGNFEARRKLAAVLVELGEAPEAQDHIEVVLTNDPDDERALDILADAVSATGDLEAADRWLRSQAQQTGEAKDWARLGRALAAIGDADRAEEALLRAARADDGRSLEYQRLLADFYRGLGNDDAAMERYRMALYIDPMNQPVREAIRSMGEVPGPSFALRPRERAGRE